MSDDAVDFYVDITGDRARERVEKLEEGMRDALAALLDKTCEWRIQNAIGFLRDALEADS